MDLPPYTHRRRIHREEKAMVVAVVHRQNVPRQNVIRNNVEKYVLFNNQE